MRELDDHQSHLIASLMRDSTPGTAAQAFASAGTAVLDPERASHERSHLPHVSRDDMLAMATSKDPYVRALVAAREDCPMGLIIALADDKSTEVRVAVAGNPNAIASVLHDLTRDRQASVLARVAANPSLPHDDLVALASNRHRNVRAVAQEQLLGHVASAASMPR